MENLVIPQNLVNVCPLWKVSFWASVEGVGREKKPWRARVGCMCEPRKSEQEDGRWETRGAQGALVGGGDLCSQSPHPDAQAGLAYNQATFP